MLTVAYRTDVGKVRRINEDAGIWDLDLGFLAIADGMGGHNAGEVAAGMAIEGVHSFMRKSAPGSDFTWPFGIDPKLSFNANRLLTAAKIANRLVFRAADQRAEYGGMGTTLVTCLVADGQLTFCSVGDSRLYMLAGSELRQLTRDDSWVVMLKEQSSLDADAVDKHPLRRVLTSVIGARSELDTTARDVEIADGQVLLLSTDGLHETIPHEEMQSAIVSEPDLERAADALLAGALARGGRDNITLLLARYAG
ncbi:MAG: PP2C family protein-serine/threonine phosphatase [Betaproteobacteria bacterium]